MGAVAAAVGALGGAIGGGGVVSSLVGTLASELIGGIFSPDAPDAPEAPEAIEGQTPEEVAKSEAARNRAMQRRQGKSNLGLGGDDEAVTKSTLLGS